MSNSGVTGSSRDLADVLLRGEVRLRSPRVFEHICEQVRAQLSAGHLTPGDKLPAERDLALQFGTSRAAVREALRSLEMAGLIELRKGVKGGAFILEGDPGVVTRSFGDMVHLGRISLESLTESRMLIQDAVVRLASVRATDDDFDALERSIDRTEQLTLENKPEERRIQLVNFYRLLAKATGNEVMVIVVDALTDIVLKTLARLKVGPNRHTVKMHREIVQCLRRRQTEQACTLMSTHLRELSSHLLHAAGVGVVELAPAALPVPRKRAIPAAKKAASTKRKAPLRGST